MNYYNEMKDLSLLMTKIEEMEMFLNQPNLVLGSRTDCGSSIMSLTNGFGYSRGISNEDLLAEEQQQLMYIAQSALKRQIQRGKVKRNELIEKFNEIFLEISKENVIIDPNKPMYTEFVSKLGEIE